MDNIISMDEVRHLLQPEKIIDSSNDKLFFTSKGIFSKENAYNLPKYCYLIGAGCSVKSGIPSGNEIISILKYLLYSDYTMLYKVTTNIQEKLFTYKEWYKSGGNRAQNYVSFVNEQKEKMKKMLSENKSNFIKTLPISVKLQYIDRYVNENKIPGTHSLTLEDKIDNYEKCALEKYCDLIWEHYSEIIYQDNEYGLWFREYSEDEKYRPILIEELMKNILPNIEYYLFAALIAEGLINSIFTTNFDDLISDALIKIDKKARVYTNDVVAEDFKPLIKNIPNIVKLHGHYLYRSTKNTTKETYELEKHFAEAFKTVLKEFGLMVIGYGGADYSVMRIIEEEKYFRKSPFKLYWCVRKNSNLNWRVVELIKNTEESYIVLIDDFGNLLVNMWRAYYKIFNKQDSINNILALNKRAKDLEDIFNRIRTSSCLDNSTNKVLQEIQQENDLNPFNDSLNRNKVKKLISIKSSDAIIKINEKTVHNDIRDKLKAQIGINKNYLLSEKESYEKGMYFAKSKDYKQSLLYFNRAIELNNNIAEYYLRRGHVYSKLGNINEALLDYNKYYELSCATQSLDFINENSH